MSSKRLRVNESNTINSNVRKWNVIILAAGYGTRLAKDILADGSNDLQPLLKLPKALLPIASVPLIDYWFKEFKQCKNNQILKEYIVTNSLFYEQFVSWALVRGISSDNIINDGTTCNEDRLGASGDIILCLNEIIKANTESDGVIIIAGDTLFYDDFNLDDYLSSLPNNTSGAVYYNLTNDLETKKRGIIEIDDKTNHIIQLLEKPDPTTTSSRKACPAFYVYSSDSLVDIIKFNEQTLHLPLDERDAPGKLLSWIITTTNNKIIAREIKGRFDIGSLDEYKYTTNHFNEKLQLTLKSLPITTNDICYARVGLLGNPSDGFKGKTISFLIKNFYTEVTTSLSNNIELLPNIDNDLTTFHSIENLQYNSITKGYYGGLRLLQATCTRFSKLCFQAGVIIHTQRNFKLSYVTNIPRMVGLSGSSAIVVATFRSLLKFYGLTISDLNINKLDFPQIILDIEKEELNISAGLQDRVIQTYGGLVHMDFTNDTPVYTSLDPSLLPIMYLAYNTNAGGESGKVHSTVKERWNNKDIELISGMNTLGSLADEGRNCLHDRNINRLCELIDQNFSIRRHLYSDNVVGYKNILAVNLATRCGLSAKFTGSGGALICIPKETLRFTENELVDISTQFQSIGFKFVEIEIP